MFKLLVTTIFSISLLFILTTQTNAQCVTCVPAPPGFGCGPSSTGGQLCTTGGNKEPTCTLTGYCSGLSGDATSCDYTKKSKNRTLEISDKTILEIGNISPKIAVNLISVRKIPVDFKTGQISIADIEIDAKDVSKYLNDKTPIEFYDSVREKVKTSFENKKMPIKYDISLVEIDGNYQLTLITSDSRVTYTGIELNFKPIKSDDEKVRLEFIGWKFK